MPIQPAFSSAESGISPKDQLQEFYARLDHIVNSLHRELELRNVKIASRAEMDGSAKKHVYEYSANHGGKIFTLTAITVTGVQNSPIPLTFLTVRQQGKNELDVSTDIAQGSVIGAYKKIKAFVSPAEAAVHRNLQLSA